MLAGNHADTNWSEKKMEADDSLRKVDCLRGRLLAERVASRVAKEDAEFMGNKLIELENQLREEIKFKNRAEKKLNFLKKKLESLKFTCVLEESEQSNSSENCQMSCKSSTSSGTKDPEEQEPRSQITNTEKINTEEVMKEKKSSTISQNLKQRVSETSLSNHSTEEISGSPTTANSNCRCQDTSLEKPSKLKSSQSCEDSKTDDHSSSSSNSSMGGIEINEEKDKVQEDYIDNSLALVLVPANLQAPSQNVELKMVSGSVRDVLEALRHAREKLQFSIERRNMNKGGSFDTRIC